MAPRVWIIAQRDEINWKLKEKQRTQKYIVWNTIPEEWKKKIKRRLRSKKNWRKKITVKKVAEEYMGHSARQEEGRSTAKQQHKAKGAGETSP